MGIPLLLLANVVLARTLSVADFGIFSFVLSLASVLAIPVAAGMPMLLTREVANYHKKNNWPAYRGILKVAYSWVVLATIGLGFAFVILKIFSENVHTQQLLIMFLLVFLSGLNAIRIGFLKGLGRPVLAEAVAQIFQPSFMIMGYIALAWFGLSAATQTLWWYLLVLCFAFVLNSIIFWKAQPEQARCTQIEIIDFQRWKKLILPFALMSGANVMSTQLAVLMLGFSGMVEVAAQMRVAERGAQMVVFPMMIINNFIGPYFIESLKAYNDTGETNPMRCLVRQSVWLTLAVSVPVALVLIVFGKPLLAWSFGMPYDMQSYQPMVILICAQLISVSLGNPGMLLAFGGYEKQTLYSLLLSLILIFGASALLIAPYGATGAAISVGAGIIIAKLYAYFMFRRCYGISTGIV